MPYKLSLYFARAKAIDSALCIRVNKTSHNLAIRVLFRLISRLGDGVFWYTIMLAILVVNGSDGIVPVVHMLVVGLSPMLAPTIGGYITEDYGWHTVFFILMFMGIIILLASQMFLPNSYEPNLSISLKPKPIITNFISIIKVPQFYTYAFSGSIAFSGLFTYVAASPILFMDIFKVDPKSYGWIFAFMSLSFIGASQLNSLLLRKFSSEKMIYGALLCQSIIAKIGRAHV